MRNPLGQIGFSATRRALRVFIVTAVLFAVAAPLAGQTLSTLDNIASMTASAPGSGMFATGRAGATGLGASAAVTAELVRNEARVLAGGGTPDELLAAVLTGGPPTGVASALTAAGAPDEQTGVLMTRLTALAYSPGMPSLKAAMQAYNALVKAAPAAFVNKPPAQLLTIRTALIAIWATR